MCRGLALLVNFRDEIICEENNSGHSQLDCDIDKYCKVEIIRDDDKKCGYTIRLDELDYLCEEYYLSKRFITKDKKLNKKLRLKVKKWCKSNELLIWKSFAKDCGDFAIINGDNNQKESKIKGNNIQANCEIKGVNNQDYTSIRGDNSQYACIINGDNNQISSIIKGENTQSFSTIEGDNNQRSSTINGDNNQCWCTIKGDNNLIESTIKGDFDLSEAIIEGEFYIRRLKLNKYPWFFNLNQGNSTLIELIKWVANNSEVAKQFIEE